jgi:hypothetical protein
MYSVFIFCIMCFRNLVVYGNLGMIRVVIGVNITKYFSGS